MTARTIHGVTIECLQGNIADQQGIDAVVCAANAALQTGAGVAGAIHGKAGPGLAQECRRLAPIRTGQAVISGAHNLPNRFVIHCLGPVYGRDTPSAELLASCYRNALKLAEEYRLASIAFPAISTGVFGYPKNEAAAVALKTVRAELPRLSSVKQIRFVLYGMDDLEIYERALEELAALTTQEKLDILDFAGLIYWPPHGQVPQQKRYMDENPGVPIQDIVTDIMPLSAQAQERLNYPTQKPIALLERIVLSSSNEGDLVLDPFCGCGTAVHAAQKLGRRWVGIDITCLAISLIERRLEDAFPGLEYEVHGTPKTLEDAIDLAARDKYQFQWWAVGAVGGRPYAGKKKGADQGIDGILFFKTDSKTTESAIISVKGGENVGVSAVRDLHSVIEREKAAIGVLVTAALPTRTMEKEAAATGFFETDFGKFPRVQIITLAELFQGKRPRIPLVDSSATFRTAAREDTTKQGKFDL